MDVLTRVRALTIAALLIAAPVAAGGAPAASDAAVKAAFIFNFAKFTEWPALGATAPIVACVAGDDEIASELVQIVKGETAGGHALEVRQPKDSAYWGECQVLFIGNGESQHFAGDVAKIRMLSILTVSHSRGFSQTGGIVELYTEGTRLRFSINLDAADRAKLHLSARLLGLAKVVRDGHVQ